MRAARCGRIVALQAHALGGQPERAQRFQVADRLGVLERRERVRLAGDLDVLGPVVEQLQEAPGLRAALVELAGRVQEARAVAERGRRLRRVADRLAQLGDRRVELGRGLHVAHDRDVARAARRRRAARAAPRRRRRRSSGSSCVGFVAGEHAVGGVLGLLHVGLVERVDLKTPAGDRDGELGEQEHAAEVGRARGRDREHGMAGLARAPAPCARARRRARGRRAGRRTRGPRRRRPGSPSGSSATGRMPVPCLPVDSATSCSSHSPRPGSVSEMTNVSLSRPACARRAQRRPQPHAAAAPVRAVRPSSSQSPRSSPVSQARGAPSSSARTATPISARRHDAEGGQRAVAPADVRVAGERPPEAVLGGERFQARAGVGDRDEAVALLDEREEVREQRQRLDRAAGLRGDDEQRSLRGRPRSSIARIAGGVGRVQHVQPRAGGRPDRAGERAAQDLRGERGAAHAQQHDVFAVRRRATSAANSSSAPSSPSIRSAIVSQPRRLAISGVSGRRPTASRRRGRSCRPRPPRWPARACSATAAWSASGMRASTVRLGSLTPRS